MPNALFLLLVVLTTVAFFALVRDFLMPVFWATVLATVFYPLQARYVVALGGRKAVAALLTMLTITLVVVLPLGLLGLAMSQEAIVIHDRLQRGEIDLGAPLRAARGVTPIVTTYLARFGVDLQKQLSTAAVTISQFLASKALSIGQNIVQITALFFLMLYVLFFFLRDGPHLVDLVVRALPLGERRERRLLTTFAGVARATIKGTLVVALAQGALGGLLFWGVGIPAPVFWGAVMAGFALVPAVGVGLVWGPAAIILLALGEIVKGVVVIAVGVLVIGLVDNLLRPILVGHDTQMPDYVVLLATLGGISVFGISGFVLGPIIAAFFLSVWEMLAQEHANKTKG